MVNHHALKPSIVTVQLPPGPMGPAYDTVRVTTFDFVDSLLDLLDDPYLVNDLALLDVNPTDPFARYQAPDGRLSTANSGAWYQRAHATCVKTSRDFLVPICFAIDETVIAETKKTGVCPVNFTTTIFGSKLRNQYAAWRSLGYIYDLSIHESKTTDYANRVNRPEESTKRKEERYQHIVAAVLKSMVDAQTNDRLKDVILTLGDKYTKVVDIVIACIFVIGDMQGGDKLCGS